MKVILNEKQIYKIIKTLAKQVLNKYKNLKNLCIIGVYTNGIYLAKRLIDEIKKVKKISIPFGYLDITFYRDDLGLRKEIKQPKETKIDFDVNDKDILLVDDVLYTGRTIRAAMEQILELGRPKTISVLVLIDRGLRELPVYAEFVGKKITTKHNQQVEIFLKEEGEPEDKVILYTKR